MKKSTHRTADAGETSSAPQFLIGCAGWALNAAVSSLFPTQGSHLERYARVFPSVEINSSFYRSHQPKTYARWADSVPDEFRFSVKTPRTITHELRLQDCEEPLLQFLDEVGQLGNKLGCLLVQLPPSLALDAETATHFFTFLRARTAVDIACEPRHASWFTAAGTSVLHAADIVRVQADPPPVTEADPLFDGTPSRYIRLHGSPVIYHSNYDETFIARVAAQMSRLRDCDKSGWCIFDNTARGAAIPNALALMEQLAD